MHNWILSCVHITREIVNRKNKDIYICDTGYNIYLRKIIKIHKKKEIPGNRD